MTELPTLSFFIIVFCCTVVVTCVGCLLIIFAIYCRRCPCGRSASTRLNASRHRSSHSSANTVADDTINLYGMSHAMHCSIVYLRTCIFILETPKTPLKRFLASFRRSFSWVYNDNYHYPDEIGKGLILHVYIYMYMCMIMLYYNYSVIVNGKKSRLNMEENTAYAAMQNVVIDNIYASIPS